MDLAYNFNSVIQNALICFNDTVPAGVTLPFVTGAATGPGTFCTTSETANPLLGNSYYTNHTNFGMTTIRFNPEKRLTPTSATASPVLTAAPRSSTICSRQVPCSTSTSSQWPT